MSDPANYLGGVGLVNGDSLYIEDYEDLGRTSGIQNYPNNDVTGLSVDRLTFASGTLLTGNPVTVTGGISFVQGAPLDGAIYEGGCNRGSSIDTISAPIVLGADVTLANEATDASFPVFQALDQAGHALTIQGQACVRIGAATTATPGPLTVQSSRFGIESGGYTASSLTLSPSTRWVMKFLSSTTVAKITSTGDVNLGGAELSLPESGYTGTADGDVITLIDKTSAGPVQGTFSGLPEGQVLLAKANSQTNVAYRVSYKGGNGNDVTLTVVNTPIARDFVAYSASGRATVPVVLTNTRATPVSVNYRTANGTAVLGTDFAESIGTLTFLPGETQKSIEVPILPGAGNGKTFGIALSTVTGSEPTLLTSTGTINTVLPKVTMRANPANDFFNPSFDAGSPSPTEDNFISVSAERPSATPITLRLSTTGGTAAAGTDYVPITNQLVTIPANTSSVMVPVGVNASGVGKNVSLTATSPTNAVIESPSEMITVPIQDKSAGKYYRVTGGTVTPGATAGNAIFNVSLVQAYASATSFSYSMSNNTARSGVDYTASSGTVTIPAGQTTAQISVPVAARISASSVSFGLGVTAGSGCFIFCPPVQPADRITRTGALPLGVINGSNPGPVPVPLVNTAVAPGESVNNGVEPSPGVPIVSQVTSPNGGAVNIVSIPTPVSIPGVRLLPTQVNLTAPLASVASPLALKFTVDGAALSAAGIPITQAQQGLRIYRDGVSAPSCSGPSGQAAPDPCISSRTVVGDDLAVTVLSSHASQWTFGLDSNFVAPSESGYWLAAADGGVFSYGAAKFKGSQGANRLNQPVVGTAPTSTGEGYWMVAADGGVFTHGDAQFFGSTGNLRLNQPIVAMVPTSDDRGYWLIAKDGGVFAFGNAAFRGSVGDTRLNSPIVAAAAATADNGGYWLFAADGGVFAFGNAAFYGSNATSARNSPVVGGAPTPDGKGYWLVAADGGVFTHGNAAFYGSAGALRLNSPIVGMAATRDGAGYALVASDGGVFNFGSSTFKGSAGATLLNQPIVGISYRN